MIPHFENPEHKLVTSKSHGCALDFVPSYLKYDIPAQAIGEVIGRVGLRM